MGLKDSLKSAVSLTPKLTAEQKLRIAQADTLYDSLKILRSIRSEGFSLKNDIEYCRDLRSELLLRSLRK